MFLVYTAIYNSLIINETTVQESGLYGRSVTEASIRCSHNDNSQCHLTIANMKPANIQGKCSNKMFAKITDFP